MRSAGEDELSEVIEREAAQRTKPPSSAPYPAKGIVAILDKLPPWGRVIVLLALLLTFASTGLASKLAGLW